VRAGQGLPLLLLRGCDVDPLSAKRVPYFERLARSSECAARVGRLHTPHGVLETPAFFPVGTYAAVRGLAPEELEAAGVQGILANTYHLHLRPGEELIARLGGLHSFMGWSRPILTDSGGFQLHSLDHLCRRSEEGVHFKSPIDGSERFLSPESCIEVQEALGADLIVTLDEFEPIPTDPDPSADSRVRALLERTLRWAQRGKATQRRSDQLLFGIVQGGGSTALRGESAERTRELGFHAFAIGGLGLGETPERRAQLLEAALEPLPGDEPRYLMGLGTPRDLVESVARGVDLFDCVLPTRHGRHGAVFTHAGPLNLRNARFRDDPDPVDAECGCSVCVRYSRAYLRHLMISGEMLGPRLLTLHNLAYYMRLLAQARQAVEKDRFGDWAKEWRRSYSREEFSGERSGGSSAATHSAA